MLMARGSFFKQILASGGQWRIATILLVLVAVGVLSLYAWVRLAATEGQLQAGRAALTATTRERDATARQAEARLALISAGQATATAGTGAAPVLQTAIISAGRELRQARAATLLAQAAEAGEHDPALAILLATAAISVTRQMGDPPPPAAEALLHQLIAQPWPGQELAGGAGPLAGVRVSPSGRQVVTLGAGGPAQVWDAVTTYPWRTLRAPAGARRAAAWAPDERSVATLSDVGVFQVWDLETGAARLTLAGATAPVPGLAWAPDGGLIAVSTGDPADTPVIRGAATGAIQARLAGPAGAVRGVAWRPDGQALLVARADGQVQLWQAADLHAPAQTLQQPTGAALAAWSPDGRRIAVVGDDSAVRFWAAGGDGVFQPAPAIIPERPGGVRDLAWSPEGGRLLTVGGDGAARVWEGLDGPAGAHEAAILRDPGPAVTTAWDPDGRTVLTAGADGTARRWDLRDRHELPPLRPYAVVEPWDQRTMQMAVYSPDGRRAATAGDDNRLRVWDVTAGQVLWSEFVHSNLGNNGPAWSPDGTRLAAGAEDGRVRIWDAAAGRLLATLPGLARGVNGLAWSPDGTRLAAGSTDGPVALWEARTGRLIALLRGHTQVISVVAWHPDGTRLLTASRDGSARVWDGGLGDKPQREVAVLRGHQGIVWAAAWSPDGTGILTVGDDGAVQVWDTATGRLRWRAGQAGNRLYHGAWSRDGRQVAAGGQDGRIYRWEAQSGRALRDLPGPAGRFSRLWQLAYSPDGRWLIAGSEAGRVSFWDAATGAAGPAFAHQGWVRALTFRADGCRLLSAGRDGMARQTILCLPELLAQATRVAGRTFTPQERARYLEPPGVAPLPSPPPTIPVAPLTPTPAPTTTPTPGRPRPTPASPPPTPGTPPSPVTTVPREPATVLFTLPGVNSPGGLHAGGRYEPYGFAVTADGSFWLGDFDKGGDGVRLLHYNAAGQPLTPVPLPEERAGLRLLEDLEPDGTDLWALAEGGRLLRLAPDGRILDEYPLPGRIDGTEVLTVALALGGAGEILLTWDSGATRPAPLLDAAGRLAPTTPLPAGQAGLVSQSYFPGSGLLTYAARPNGDATGPRPGGVITSGTTTVPVTTTRPLLGLYIFHVRPDGSFYVLAEEQAADGASSVTVLRYGGDGRPLGRAAVPLAGRYTRVVRRLAVGPDGTLYVLAGAGGSQPFTVQRLNFYPPDAPLPTPGALPPTPPGLPR
jgi:WD40 repeat protein